MKILQITDLHFATFPFEGKDIQTAELIKRLVLKHQPNLLVVTGDLISNDRVLDGLSVFQGVIDFLDALNVPIAITFGNHDSEGHMLSKLYQKMTEEKTLDELTDDMPEVFKNFDHFIQYDRHAIIDIVNQMSNHVKKEQVTVVDDREMYYINFNTETRLLFVDSGDYDPYQIGTYDSLTFNQHEWLLKNANSSDQVSHLFIHIPLPEYNDAIIQGKATGYQDEKVCSAEYNTGTWARIKFNTNIKAVYCGHDHENDFSSDYYGTQLNYGRVTGYNSYGKYHRGGRIIEIEGSKFHTYIVE